MSKLNIVKFSAILVGCVCIMLVLAAPLPGEVEGCDSESNEAADLVAYCTERCQIKAYKEVVECHIFNGDVTEQQIFELCYTSLSCNEPDRSICVPECQEPLPELCGEDEYWQPFVSVSEANKCLDALRRQHCDALGNIPPECNEDAICDSK